MQFGVLVKNLGDSELNWRLISNANYLMDNGIADIIFFYEDISQYCVVPHGSIMQVVEAYEYKYPLIATSLTTAQKLISFPRQSKSIFYLWDLEWLRYPDISFNVFKEIYNSPKLELVVRNTEHKSLVQDLWNKDVHKISENANLMEILYES